MRIEWAERGAEMDEANEEVALGVGFFQAIERLFFFSRKISENPGFAHRRRIDSVIGSPHGAQNAARLCEIPGFRMGVTQRSEYEGDAARDGVQIFERDDGLIELAELDL